MTQRLVHRPARQELPKITLDPVDVNGPLTLPESGGGMSGIMQVAMPLLGGAGMLSMFMANRNPTMLMAGAGMLVAMVGGGIFMFVSQRTGSSKRLRDQRR